MLLFSINNFNIYNNRPGGDPLAHRVLLVHPGPARKVNSHLHAPQLSQRHRAHTPVGSRHVRGHLQQSGDRRHRLPERPRKLHPACHEAPRLTALRGAPDHLQGKSP